MDCTHELQPKQCSSHCVKYTATADLLYVNCSKDTRHLDLLLWIDFAGYKKYRPVPSLECHASQKIKTLCFSRQSQKKGKPQACKGGKRCRDRQADSCWIFFVWANLT